MFSDLRMKSGLGISNKDKELLESFSQKDFSKEEIPEIFSDQMTCFLFESVIRPNDKALVIHLKHLPPALRNPKFFEFATIFIRDRVGKFESLDVSFIGELDSVNKLNSLDLMFTKYYPALMGDMDFIAKHTAKIGKELDTLLCRELGEYASSIKRS